MKHGGDVLSYKKYYEGEIVDYSSNINPLGVPKGLVEELKKCCSTIVSYPDIKYRKLRESISKYLKCKDENVIVGNGAVEIIDNFVQLFNRVIVFLPAFSEYELRAIVHKKDVVKIKFKENFKVDIEKLKNITQKGDLIVLGNPNNPTGLRLKKKELLAIYKLVRERQAFLLLDEAFFEFCPEDYDSINIFKEYNFERVAIIRAATKFFALPGLRLGYGCTSLKWVNKYNEIALPWSVNAMADCAGRYIFDCKDYIEESKRYINEERKFLIEELLSINGFKVFPTDANFILIKLLKWNEELILKHMLKRGFLIRKCSSFEGLDDTFVRIAIKDRKNNERLVKAFRELER